MATESTTADNDTEPSKLNARWGEAMSDGFLVVPRLLLIKQRELGLTNIEVVTLMNLLASWWKEDDLPYPAVPTMAHRMGVSVRTLQRTLEDLEEKGYISRVRNSTGNGRSSNLRVTRYLMTGTVEKIKGSKSLRTPERDKPLPSKYNAGRLRKPDQAIPGISDVTL